MLLRTSIHEEERHQLCSPLFLYNYINNSFVKQLYKYPIKAIVNEIYAPSIGLDFHRPVHWRSVE